MGSRESFDVVQIAAAIRLQSDSGLPGGLFMSRLAVSISAVCALVLFPSIARADAIVISGGQFGGAAILDGGVIRLISDRFDITTGWGPGTNSVNWCFTSGCFPGDVVDFSTTTVPGGSGGSGPGTVDGVKYDLAWYGPGGTRLQFDVPPITLPSTLPAGDIQLAPIPFSMSGFLSLTPILGDRLATDPIFAGNVTGSGQLFMSLAANPGNGRFNVGGAEFRFAPATAPTPEPASLALVIAGLAGVSRRALRARRR